MKKSATVQHCCHFGGLQHSIHMIKNAAEWTYHPAAFYGYPLYPNTVE